MPSVRSSLALRVGAAALLALLVAAQLPAAAAQVVTADQCLRDPSASVSVGATTSGAARPNGAIFACPTDSNGGLIASFAATVAADTADNLQYVASASFSVCPSGGGACLASSDLTSSSPRSVPVALSNPGAYTFQVTAATGPRNTQGSIDPLRCSSFDNKQCTQRCRSCTQQISVQCYYQDAAGLTAAQAASPTGGAGSTAGTITASALVAGTPFQAASFGASLPLAAGQALNPRCKLDSLTFRRAYVANSPTFAIPLPADGSDTVVIRDCAAITPEQVALITASTSGGASNPSTTTYLSLDSPLLCEDVLAYNSGSSRTVDGRVTSYNFGGDLATAPPVSNVVNGLVCADTYAHGPVAGLPAASWRSASFSVTAAHTSAFSLCDDQSCVGGNADGRCSACSYTYTVRFACDEVAPPTNPPSGGGGGGGIIGDPQFVGLRGQSYQVHGVSGEVYNIVSSPALQYNARFVFLSSGACPVVNGVRQRRGCYSHPGSYLGELGLKTAAADAIHIEAGSAAAGFAAVTLNERALAVGETALLSDGSGAVSRNSSHVVSVTAGQWSFVFDNSDRFVNQRVAVSGDMAALRSHGLLGQTWREAVYPHSPIKFLQGAVDDYAIREGDVFGDEFAFNAFN